MKVLEFLNNSILWGPPMLILMLVTGLRLTFLTKGIIFKKFNVVLKNTILNIKRDKSSENSSSISPFAAVSTALAATVGTGNIVGVAVAIGMGGPGAIFWMWTSALIGMVIKYSEVTLAVAYRKKNDTGFYGGPMYYIENGIGSHSLAVLFSIFGALSSFGIGNMVQANSLSEGIYMSFGINPCLCGVILSVLCGFVLIGGIKRISSVAEILVPFMAFFYMGTAIIVLIANYKNLLPSLLLIFKSAFNGQSIIGGFSGASIGYIIRTGVSRGLFTNEAGLGSAPIAHASADVSHPVIQGMWGTFEVFFDTIIMCTITALVVISSGVWQDTFVTNKGLLVHIAFKNVLPFGDIIVSTGLILFSFASIIAWYYYGEKCVEFLFKKKGIPIYRVLYVSACFFGCIMNISAVWELSDTLNAFMAIPNLIALIFLGKKLKKLTLDFFQ